MTRGARPNVVVLDYGSGNLRSAERALQRVGADIVVTADADSALDAAGLVVPGVGAFASCMTGLRAVRGDMIIAKRLAEARPVLGICVGMQVLFAQGVEHGERTAGCGVWPGVVERLEAPVLPHMGWNTVSPPAGSRLFAGIGADERFYFVHSYAVRSWPVRAEAIRFERMAIRFERMAIRFERARRRWERTVIRFERARRRCERTVIRCDRTSSWPRRC